MHHILLIHAWPRIWAGVQAVHVTAFMCMCVYVCVCACICVCVCARARVCAYVSVYQCRGSAGVRKKRMRKRIEKREKRTRGEIPNQKQTKLHEERVV